MISPLSLSHVALHRSDSDCHSAHKNMGFWSISLWNVNVKSTEGKSRGIRSKCLAANGEKRRHRNVSSQKGTER